MRIVYFLTEAKYFNILLVLNSDLGKCLIIWWKTKASIQFWSFSKGCPCRQHVFFLCIWPERKREASVLSCLTSEERLMVVYFGNVIHSVSPYLNNSPTWVCISLNSLEPISDRACYRLIHRYIQDAGAFCSSNAKHLTSDHRSHSSSGKGQVSSENKMRQRSDKIRKWRGHFQVSDRFTKWLENIIW